MNAWGAEGAVDGVAKALKSKGAGRFPAGENIQSARGKCACKTQKLETATDVAKLYFRFLAPTIRRCLARESDLVDKHFLALTQSSGSHRVRHGRPAFGVFRSVHVWLR